ncbi:MAG: class I SAM-dependent methyltransferase, partial [Acidobacteriota bacterium]
MYRSKQAVWRGASAMLLCAALGVSGGAQEDSTEAAVTDSGDHHSHSEHAYAHHAVHHDFSNAEEWAARFDSPERAAWQKPDEVVALLAIEPGMSVVDLGAGTGFFLKHLSQAAGADGVVQALDPEVEMVRYMSQRAEREGLANVEARQIPFDDPELAEGSVDRILIVNTWHHIEEREAYSQKLYDALEPGGRVFIVDFTRDSPSGPPVAARLLPDQVIAELTAGGLEARVVEETLPRQYVVVGRRERPPKTP